MTIYQIEYERRYGDSEEDEVLHGIVADNEKQALLFWLKELFEGEDVDIDYDLPLDAPETPATFSSFPITNLSEHGIVTIGDLLDAVVENRQVPRWDGKLETLTLEFEYWERLYELQTVREEDTAECELCHGTGRRRLENDLIAAADALTRNANIINRRRVQDILKALRPYDPHAEQMKTHTEVGE